MLALGFDFQIIDDVMDYTASAATMGKNVGDDLAEGKPTLPLIYTLQQADQATQTQIKQAIETGSKAELDSILAAMHDHGAFDYCHAITKRYIEQARHAAQQFPESPYQQALISLCDFVTHRQF